MGPKALLESCNLMSMAEMPGVWKCAFTIDFVLFNLTWISLPNCIFQGKCWLSWRDGIEAEEGREPQLRALGLLVLLFPHTTELGIEGLVGSLDSLTSEASLMPHISPALSAPFAP